MPKGLLHDTSKICVLNSDTSPTFFRDEGDGRCLLDEWHYMLEQRGVFFISAAQISNAIPAAYAALSPAYRAGEGF